MRKREATSSGDTAVTMPLPGVSRARWKRADTTSAVGAGVLGAGIGVLLAGFLDAYAIPIAGVGLLMHAWGMYDKHRLERDGGIRRLWWAEALYWGCWIALLVLALYAVLAIR